MTEVAAPAGGMEKVLSELKCTMPEFIFIVVFWVGACILASFVDPSYITGNKFHAVHSHSLSFRRVRTSPLRHLRS